MTNELQRLFENHQGIGELFLMKVIEKNRGKQHLRQFLEKNLKQGF
jgi:hypothetical protein